MAKSTKIILIVVILVLAVLGIVYISKGQSDQDPTDDYDFTEDELTEDTTGNDTVKVKHYTPQEQKFHDKVAEQNKLTKDNIIKQGRKLLLTGGLSGIVNSSNNVTSAINKLFKKKK